MRYRLDVRLAVGDVGRRVVIRWRRPAGKNGEETAVAETAPHVTATIKLDWLPGQPADRLSRIWSRWNVGRTGGRTGARLRTWVVITAAGAQAICNLPEGG